MSSGTFQGSLKFGKDSLSVPPSSPFAKLSLGQPWLVLELFLLQFTSRIPHAIARKHESINHSEQLIIQNDETQS